MNNKTNWTEDERRYYEHVSQARPKNKRHMTKKEAWALFRKMLICAFGKYFDRSDIPALREAWNNYTDSLCKGGEISSRQYETWTNPF